jgi:tRNA U38,U39,U40 pseudouridine synthase TruA
VRMSPRQLQLGINACLPGAIRLLGVARAHPAFSARHRCV